jgi:DNA-binding CsgD family transcriptional regulator
MSSPNAGPALRGRRRECEVLDDLVASVRAGTGRALVLRGESGVGKTALLEHLVERASGCRLARAAGVESEMELPFAALHQLCAPMLGHLDHLPGPQQSALATAFGLRAGEPPDRFLIGLAVLSLLADAGEHRPLLALVDDAQWLDRMSAQTLAFVARRLLADHVALVFSVRAPCRLSELTGLDELDVGALGRNDSRALLLSVAGGPVDERVLERIVAEARGNPLALLELPRSLTPAELAGGFASDTTTLAGRIEQGFLRRLEPLPAETRKLLLAAAVEPVGNAAMLWRAAQRLSIGRDAAAPAEASGLIEIGARVRFRHPLVRSAARRAAGPEDLRAVYRALADTTDPELDPDRRAWYLAHAASGPDEAVAAELERSAGRAQRRGGIAAAAAFLERATVLTPDPEPRADRALNAAEAKQQAGSADAAMALLALARDGPPVASRQARADRLAGRIAYDAGRVRDAPALLMKAAQRLEPLDAALSRATYLEAFGAALLSGRMTRGVSLLDIAAAARSAPAAPRPSAPDDLLDGLATIVTEGYAQGAPALKRAVRAFRDGDLEDADAIRWLWLATHAAHDLWDDESWHELTVRQLRIARTSGALAVLPVCLSARVGLQLQAGALMEAARLVEELEAVVAAIGSRLPRYGAIALAAWQGRAGDAEAMIGDALEGVAERGEGMGLSLIRNAEAVLYNGRGQYEKAAEAGADAVAHPAELGFATLALPELVVAASRSGKPGLAAQAIRRLSETTRASATEWALGIEAQSRALLSGREDAEAHYLEAIERLGRTRVRLPLARAHLLYGEWLRREHRRVDARQQLRTAHDRLSAMGAQAFAERARLELLATGETARKRTIDTRDDLTAQEDRIARLARDGLSNPEIGAQLFISSRTVEYHLRKVFAKLRIRSRVELDRVLVHSEEEQALLGLASSGDGLRLGG